MSYTEKDYNQLSGKIIACCMEVHRELGPGLMESVYEVCAEHVMTKNGLFVKRQVILPVTFKGNKLDKEFVIDTIVNDLIILGYKSIMEA